jgi:MFS family permease
LLESSRKRATRVPAPPLPGAVWLFGLASLLNDASSEAVFPLLGVFLGTLGAPMGFVGLALGAADTIAVVVKIAAGRWSDRLRRPPLVIGGYLIAAGGRGLIALAGAPWQVLVARSLDRVGKAIRSGARDAMLADAVSPRDRGRAFGFTQALDHVGAAIGPLVASVCIARGLSLPATFGIAAGLGLLAPLLLAARLREPVGGGATSGGPRHAPTSTATVSPDARAAVGTWWPRRLALYLTAVGLFAFANSSDAFILIRAAELGFTAATLPLLWLGHHLIKSVTTAVGGSLSDRLPRPILIVGGWLAFGAAYWGFSLATRAWHMAALMGGYALYHGLAEGPERALVSDLVGPGRRGTAFGLYHGVVGAAALPAGLLMGGIWDRRGASAAFRTDAVLAVAAAVLLAALVVGGALQGRDEVPASAPKNG